MSELDAFEFDVPFVSERRNRRLDVLVLLGLTTVLSFLASIVAYVLATSHPAPLLLVQLCTVDGIVVSLVVVLALIIRSRIGELPETISVMSTGFTVNYPSGRKLSFQWAPSQKCVRLVDGHLIGEREQTSRRILIERRTGFPISEGAQVAILASARARSAIMTEGPVGRLWGKYVKQLVLGVSIIGIDPPSA